MLLHTMTQTRLSGQASMYLNGWSGQDKSLDSISSMCHVSNSMARSYCPCQKRISWRERPHTQEMFSMLI